jgi:hypothetical protein
MFAVDHSFAIFFPECRGKSKLINRPAGQALKDACKSNAPNAF